MYLELWLQRLVIRKGLKIGNHYGISLKELRTPNQGEAIIAEVKTCINVSIRHCLFEVDEIWAKENGLNLQSYKQQLII